MTDIDKIMEFIADIVTEADVDFPAGYDAGPRISYDEPAIRAYIRAALDTAEATIAALTTAIAALAQDNARLGKRVEALRAIADLAEISGVEFKRKYPELNRLLDHARREDWGSVISEFAARAWLAGGDA